MKQIFIIGSKGIPAKYGGFETFVDELVSRQQNEEIQYYISCMSNEHSKFTYKKGICFNIKVPPVGPIKAVLYDLKAMNYCIKEIKNNRMTDSIVYVLACRIGPFFNFYSKKLHKLNCKVYVNPDGHEWKRDKWNYFIKKYWKVSERLMVKYADLLICDSKNIMSYMKSDYKRFKPKTVYIPYGAEVSEHDVDVSLDQKLTNWFKSFEIKSKEYYLIVGRFVPENNYETMIKGFMLSNTKKDLVIITNVEKNKFYNTLSKETNFDTDKRVKFVGTVYDQSLLCEIRKEAYAYIHGHSVGGTNPSLLEALATTNINLLYDVGFNREVGKESAFYFSKSNLTEVISKIENISLNDISLKGEEAKLNIKENFSWLKVIQQYEALWVNADD